MSLEHLLAQRCHLNICSLKEGGALNLRRRKSAQKLEEIRSYKIRNEKGPEKKEIKIFFLFFLQTWFNNSNLSIGVSDHQADPTEHPVCCPAQR